MIEEIESREPSDAELRSMLDARELEKDLARDRTRRTFNVILLVSITALSGVIWLFPKKPLYVVSLPAKKPAPLVQAPRPPSSSLENSDPGLAHDLAPFTPQPGESNQSEDIRFAMQLLNFMDAPSLKQTIPLKEAAPAKKP